MSPKFYEHNSNRQDCNTVWRSAWIRIVAPCFLASLLAPHGLGQNNNAGAQFSLPGQHFVCNTGYRRDDCHAQCVKLATVLARYRAALPSDWTWILVRSQDWGPIARGLNLNEKSPAFSVLAKQQTFLDEALFGANAPGSAALPQDFGVALDHVLEYAVTHELGHAFCMEAREHETAQLAEQLVRTGSMQCKSPPNKRAEPTPRDTVRTLDPPK